MDTHRTPQTLDAYAEKLVCCTVRQLINWGTFPESDREDLEQELRLAILTRLPQFDPGKAKLTTFVARVVENRVKDLLRHRQAEMRAVSREGRSLGDAVETNDGAEPFGNMLTDADRTRRFGQSPLSDEERACLLVDLSRVLDTLAGELRQLCEELKTRTVTQIAAERKVQRLTVYQRVWRIRKLFRRASLGDYLKKG